MEEKIGFGAFVVIPTSLLMDENVSSPAKLTFGIISNLSNQRGYCFASNSYICEMFNVHENTISKHISELINAGYLIRFDEVTAFGLQRRLALSDPIKDEVGKQNQGGGSTKSVRGSHTNQGGGVNENADHNNIRLITKENTYTELGKRNDNMYVVVNPELINSQVYRINGEDGLEEFFQMNFSTIQRPEFCKKFFLERLGKSYKGFRHLWNDYNQFVNNQFKR